MTTTDTHIVEGNKLIAEFMGGKLKYYSISNEPYYQMPDNQQWMPERLVYHSSWDCLMPVVEKIEGIKNSDDYEVDIFGNCCDIGGRCEAVGKTKIEATWKAVVMFMQWYNPHPKP